MTYAFYFEHRVKIIVAEKRRWNARIDIFAENVQNVSEEFFVESEKELFSLLLEHRETSLYRCS